ncbi:MAG TPA: DNA recombination protein RmuC [Allosphingosinicella sp.]|nr:DNA recombination protein RmuC [Allosphingosinicella sp.]
MDPLVLLVAAALIAAGIGLGWFLGGRAAASLAEERGEAAKLLRLQLTALEGERDEANRLREEAQRELAGINAARVEREAAMQEQIKALIEAKDALSAQFSKIGQEILNAAQQKFLDGANERLVQQGKDSQTRLSELLRPVSDTLKRYEENLKRVENDRMGSYGELKAAVAQLTQGNESVRKETQRLANVMRSSPKARGRWGEEQLRTILESAGLAENIDFSLQGTVSDGERQIRPDCVINLPGGRCIVVDVKCPLVHFEQAFDEEDEAVRADLLAQHAASMKAYATDLGRKGYWRQFDLSPDFVIMFIPGEHFLSAAAERAPELIESAYRQGVIIASTINMLALAKVMAGMWRQEALAAQAAEIAQLGKELHARLQVMGSHVFDLGRNLRLATESYNDFVGSLDRNVLTQAKRFETLKVAEGNKLIKDPPVIDFTPRATTKLIDNAPPDEAVDP